ncbi:hypothetical protein CG740_17560 [Streptomyces sp. CB01201]|nr:hypothetical protein CG740_17560 [Streptomyces sp. CB01201]
MLPTQEQLQLQQFGGGAQQKEALTSVMPCPAVSDWLCSSPASESRSRSSARSATAAASEGEPLLLSFIKALLSIRMEHQQAYLDAQLGH